MIGHVDPLGAPQAAARVADKGVTLFALELLPRITRAQSMDVLSSMATVAGYKAVLLAANELPRMFPLLMTAAGTVPPARVLVIGAGVAGLQAIATAKRLGAVIKAYDVRPAARAEVESLGATFLELPLETAAPKARAATPGSWMKTSTAANASLLTKVLEEIDVVITTAAIPGAKAPVLITAEMVGHMQPRSVIVDLAAATGGNCELTRPDETIVTPGRHHPRPHQPALAPVAHDASLMYARNIATFLGHLTDKSGKP